LQQSMPLEFAEVATQSSLAIRDCW
jgi:hypothetical protein